MKTPKSLPYFVLFFLTTSVLFSQTKALATLPKAFYFSKEKSILESTEASDHHTILMAGLTATDLEDVLGTSGPFTFFAPSDNAFSKFSKEELAVLFKEENKNQLKSLLTYHIVAGNLTASKILRALCSGKGQTKFTTVQGTKITATMNGMDIILTDSFGNAAKITTADSNQSNGVIHEIDSVILPSKI